MTELLLLGGSGVLGRAVLSFLRGRDVVATTRSPDKLDMLSDLGARGVICDVSDSTALLELMTETRPEVVANFVTDLGTKDFSANRETRRLGGPNVVEAARAAGARRLVIESVSFGDQSDEGLAILEGSALKSGLEAVIIRFGLFWGPGTWYEVEPEDDLPHVHVDEAGRRAADLIFDAAPGIYLV